MRIFIITIDEPIYINNYTRGIIETRHDDIIGIAVLKPDWQFPNLKSLKKSIKNILLGYLIFSKTALARLACYKLLEILSCCIKIHTNHRIADICSQFNIPVYYTNDPNSPLFLDMLRKMDIDVILHQTQRILKQEIISLPKKCVINRHMSCLPSYRGSFPVFWQFYNDEPQYGLTIHVVDEGIDSGKIIVQKSIQKKKDDSIASAYEKLFSISIKETQEALDKIRQEDVMIDNNTTEASCFRAPSFKEMFKYMFRLNQFLFFWCRLF